MIKKTILFFLVVNFLCGVPVSAAKLELPSKTISLIDRASAAATSKSTLTDAVKNGFVTANGKTRYYENGKLHKGFLALDNKTYYFNEKGIMQTGSRRIQDADYFFDSDGVMQTGFVKNNSKTYYYDVQTGKKIFGSRKIGKYRYYFKEKTGVMATGFLNQELNGTYIKTYYSGKGRLKTGTFRVSHVEYKAAKKTGKIYSMRNLAAVICQRPELPTGCEITSWTMMANYAGIKIEKTRAADIMPKSSDPNQGFVGSPYSSSGASLVVYPGGLRGITQEYFKSYEDMTGCSLKQIQEKLWEKHLVLAWITRLDGFGSHTVALTGYDPKGFFYNDPWTGGKSKISNEEFSVIWNENACRALSY